MEDTSRVEKGTKFHTALYHLVRKMRPGSIIETGTYDGKGSTTVIAEALRDTGNRANFYTIECNPERFELARKNLASAGLGDYVKQVLGLTIPRSMLPSKEEIHRLCFPKHPPPRQILVDNKPENCVDRYVAETDYSGIPDDRLGECVKSLGGKADLVFLDSGGHIGWQEFQYAMSLITSPCFIVLDDVFHIKHYRSYVHMMVHSAKFSIKYEDEEKNGFCIAFKRA